MRIEKLSLDFFGHFTGKVIDFGKAGGASDFHLIHGPNEAGKTTTMEGYLRLLYGFAHKEPYGFQHQRQNLRVSGLLDFDGTTRLFTRLPSRSGNLRGEADAVLPETALASHLAGLSLEDYRSLLCLDDDTIEKGGEDIANARGDIGRLLFSAAAGVADLNAVLEQARAEAGGIYKKRASTTRVAALKRELAEIENSIRELDISAHAWRKLKEALHAASSEEAQAREQRDALRVDQARVAAMRRALPNLGELDRLQDAIAAYADFPVALDIDPEDLVRLMNERGQANAELQRLKESLDQTAAERDACIPDADGLALAERLDALDELRSRTTTAKLDIPKRARIHDEALADMTHIAWELGASQGCEATRLVISPTDIAMLEQLRDKARESDTARQTGAREIETLEKRVAQANETQQSLSRDQPTEPGLNDLLARYDPDTLAPAFAAATQAIASVNEGYQSALDTLAIGTTSFAELPECPVDPAMADDLASRHADLSEKTQRAEERLVQLEEDRAAMAAKIARLAKAAGVASDEEAQGARARRDALWQAHRDALTEQTADNFAPSMKHLDDIEAARLAHASELGELRKLEQDLAETEARAANTMAQRDLFRSMTAEIETQVTGLAAGIGLPSLSPNRFAAWVADHGKAKTAQRQRDRTAAAHENTLKLAERLRRDLAPIVALESASFDAALTAGRRLAEAERAQRDKLRAAKDKTDALIDELDRRRRVQEVLTDTADGHAEAWTGKVRELFGDTLSPERLASALGQLRDLREQDAKRLQAERQISTMQDDQRRFTEGVAALGLGFDIPQGDPLEAFRLLRGVADRAQADKSRHRDLCAKLEQDTRRCAELNAKLEDIDRIVSELGAVFPESVDTGTLDALRNAVATARDVISSRIKIADLEARILDDLSVRRIEEARALIGEEPASGLEARQKSLETDIALAEKRLSDATVARANAERDLAALSGGAEIAELVEQRATLQMQIEEAVLEYLEWDFGLRSAEEAIRRYRDTHRSEMMAATERAFVDLTNGAYRKLQALPDGASEILLAIDADGRPKQIGEMSKGTRFQLYLALRAAAYEQMVAQGVQLPFFCDDVFETFDEERTRAACRLMERISKSGQAIYLTHHRHVVDIAKAVCVEQPNIHEI
ncbi:MAG: AAA family ATPase [Roseivivax sp.]|nr:AAA family ATPase [Roseivivax sp.]